MPGAIHLERIERKRDQREVADCCNQADQSAEANGISMMYWYGLWTSKPHDNAFGFRRLGFEFWIHTYWQNAVREKSCAWVEKFYAAMEPFSTGAVYVNDLEDEGKTRVRAAYGDK